MSIKTAFLFLLLNASIVSATSNRLDRKVERFHKKYLSIDTHNDTPMRLLRGGFDMGITHDTQRSKVDFVRMHEGGLDAAFFAVFTSQSARDSVTTQKVYKKALQTIDSIEANVLRNSNLAKMAFSSNDAYTHKKDNVASVYIGMENGYPLGKESERVEEFYKLGVRYITLCHSWNNDICDSSTDSVVEHNGVSDLGKQIVAEMNRLGMIIDVSHMSDKSFYDIIDISTKPVIASHSCSRKMCDNPRNMSDDMIKRLADNNGVIQMCILSNYVKDTGSYAERDSAKNAVRKKYGNYSSLSDDVRVKFINDWYDVDKIYPPNLANVSDVVDHIDHIVNLVGINHVGIGTDFDGGGGVDGCKDVSEMKNITKELFSRGYSNKEIKKIWGENFIRVFRANESIANQ